MVPHPWCFFIPSGRLCAGRSEGRGEGASGAMGTEGAMIRCVGRCLGLAVWTASSESRMCLVPVHEGQRRVGRSRLLTAPPLSPASMRRAIMPSSVYGGDVLKCWRGGRDDLALPSRRARARVSAAGDASLRPWPREPLASTGCLRGGAPMRRFAAIPSAIHQYILSSPGICGGGADTDFTRISHRDSGFSGGSGAGPGVF